MNTIFEATEQTDNLVRKIVKGATQKERAEALADFCNLLQGQSEIHKKALLICAVFSLGYEQQPNKKARADLANTTLEFIEAIRNERKNYGKTQI